MNNFDLHTSACILFGKGAIEELCGQIPTGARVLITYGGNSVKKTGVLDQVSAAPNGLDVLELGGTESSPSCETLVNAAKLAHEEKVVFLLTVNGSSVLDGTKFIVAAAHYDAAIDLWGILEARGGEITSAIPMDLVLTLSATGSELSKGAVTSRKTTGDRRAFMFSYVQLQFAILDPVYTYTLPPHQTANGVADAFVHTVEQYVTYPVDGKTQNHFVEGILLTLVEDGPEVLQRPESYDMRASIMWAATQALNGLIGAGVPQDRATYTLGHKLTAMYGLDHAQTLAIVLSVLRNEKHGIKRAKLLQYVECVWSITEDSEEQRIDVATTATHSFFGQIRVPTRLPDYGLDGGSTPTLLARLGEYGMTKLDRCQDVTPDVSYRTYEAAR